MRIKVLNEMENGNPATNLQEGPTNTITKLQACIGTSKLSKSNGDISQPSITATSRVKSTPSSKPKRFQIWKKLYQSINSDDDDMAQESGT